jgi:hypothetical protein
MKSIRNRWLSIAIGTALLGGFAAYPHAMRTAVADDGGHNPRIHHALEALHDARDEISSAGHDFHGHKQEALDAIDRAIEKLDEIKDW